MARKKNPPIPLTQDHIARLDRDALAALSRRGGKFFVEQSLAIAEIVLVASAALAALWVWEAPPLTMLLLMLAATWLSILGELVKALALRKAVQREMAVENSDRFVWAVTSALIEKRNTFEWTEIEVPLTLRALLVVDILCMSVATGLVLLMLETGGYELNSLLVPDFEVIALFTVTFLLQAAGVAWVVLQHCSGRGALAPPRSTAGFRGLIAYPVAMLMFFAIDAGLDLRGVLSVFNGAAIVVVAPLMWSGQLRMRKCTQWLRERASSVCQSGSA